MCSVCWEKARADTANLAGSVPDYVTYFQRLGFFGVLGKQGILDDSETVRILVGCLRSRVIQDQIAKQVLFIKV